jgi:hypothetical protein
VEPERRGPPAQKIRVADDVEGRNVERGTTMPDRKRKVGPDPGGFPEGQCQRFHDFIWSARSQILVRFPTIALFSPPAIICSDSESMPRHRSAPARERGACGGRI